MQIAYVNFYFFILLQSGVYAAQIHATENIKKKIACNFNNITKSAISFQARIRPNKMTSFLHSKIFSYQMF